MKCHEIVELLSEYLDGELDVGSRSEVDGHLAVCESCQRELHQLKATISLVASLPKATAPAALAQRVGEEAQDEMQAAASKRRLWYLFPALAAAAAVLIAIQIAPRRTPPTPETEWNSLKTLSSDEIAANMRNAPARETVPALRDLSEMDAMADSGKPKREQFAKEAGRLVETVGAGGAAKADDALRQIAVPSAPQAAMPHFRTEESPRSLGSLKLVSESYVEAKKVQPTPAQEAERPAEAAAKPSRDEERVIVAAQNMAKAREAIENALKANRLAMEPVQGEPDTFRVTTLLHSHDRTLILAELSRALASEVGKDDHPRRGLAPAEQRIDAQRAHKIPIGQDAATTGQPVRLIFIFREQSAK